MLYLGWCDDGGFGCAEVKPVERAPTARNTHPNAVLLQTAEMRDCEWSVCCRLNAPHALPSRFPRASQPMSACARLAKEAWGRNSRPRLAKVHDGLETKPCLKFPNSSRQTARRNTKLSAIDVR